MEEAIDDANDLAQSKTPPLNYFRSDRYSFLACDEMTGRIAIWLAVIQVVWFIVIAAADVFSSTAMMSRPHTTYGWISLLSFLCWPNIASVVLACVSIGICRSRGRHGVGAGALLIVGMECALVIGLSMLW